MFGLSERSAHDRLKGERVTQNGKEYVLKELPDGSGNKVPVENYYTTIGAYPMEDHVYNATNLRMRDISLSYNFSNLLGKNTGLTAQFSIKIRQLIQISLYQLLMVILVLIVIHCQLHAVMH